MNSGLFYREQIFLLQISMIFMPITHTRQPVHLLVLSALILISCSRSARNYVERGDQLAASGNFVEASLNYKQAMQKEPENSEICYKLAETTRALGDLRGAYALNKRAVELAPRNTTYKVRLGDAAVSILKTESKPPAPVYEHLVRLVQQIESETPHSFDALRLKGQIALLDKQYGRATTLLGEANQVRANERTVLLPLAQALTAAGRSAEAEAVAVKATERDSSFEDMYDFLYARYVVSDRVLEAENLLKLRASRNPKDLESWVKLAGFYAADGRMDEAEAAAVHVVRDPAQFPDGRLTIGDMYSRLGKLPEALRHFEEGARADPARRTTYEKRSTGIYWMLGKRETALELVQAVLKRAPDDDEARRMRGSFLLGIGRKQDVKPAIDDYSALLRKDPADPVLNYQLGRGYRLLGDDVSAGKYFQAALKSNKKHLSARLALAEIDAGAGRYEETLRCLDEILAVDRQTPRVHLLRTATLRNLGRLTEARTEFGYLRNERDLDTRIEGGLLFLAEGRLGDAERVFASLYQPGATDARAGMGLVRALIRRGQTGRAVQLLQVEVQKSSHPDGPLVALGDISAGAGKTALAAEQYRRAFTLNPKNPIAAIKLGQLEMREGHLEDGIKSLRQAVAVDPGNTGAQLALATALHLVGQKQEAASTYRLVLNLDPSNLNAMNNLAYVSVELGDLDEALRMARSAAQRSPENLSYSDTLGLVYLKKNMPDSALQIFRTIVAKQPKAATFRLHLAMAYLSKGDRKRAGEELKAALGANPTPIEAHEIRRLLPQVEPN